MIFLLVKFEEKYFGWFLVKFDNGKLEVSAVMRGRSRKCVKIEKKLIRYLDLRVHKYDQDKCGLRWIFMENKLLKFE